MYGPGRVSDEKYTLLFEATFQCGDTPLWVMFEWVFE